MDRNLLAFGPRLDKNIGGAFSWRVNTPPTRQPTQLASSGEATSFHHCREPRAFLSKLMAAIYASTVTVTNEDHRVIGKWGAEGVERKAL